MVEPIDPSDDGNYCSKMFNKSLEAFDNNRRLRPPNFTTPACSKFRKDVIDITVCNCCTTYLKNCARKNIEKIERLLNDTELWRPSQHASDSQSSKGVC